MRNPLPLQSLILAMAPLVIVSGCGGSGGGGGIFSSEGSNLDLNQDGGPAQGMVSGIATAHLVLENDTNRDRTVDLSISGGDAQLVLADDGSGDDAEATDLRTRVQDISLPGWGSQAFDVEVLCLKSDERRDVTVTVRDTADGSATETALVEYECAPPDIALGGGASGPVTVHPDHSARYVRQHFPIEANLPPPPPAAFGNFRTIDLQVTATPDEGHEATANPSPSVWREEGYRPELASGPFANEGSLLLAALDRQSNLRVTVHWSCPELPGTHDLAGSVQASLAGSRFEWSSEPIRWEQVCEPPPPPNIVFLPARDESPSAYVSEFAQGHFRLVNQSPISRAFSISVDAEGKTQAAEGHDIPELSLAPHTESAPLPYSVLCDGEEARPKVTVTASDPFIEQGGINDRISATCEGTPLALAFPSPQALLKGRLSGGHGLAYRHFAVRNNANPTRADGPVSVEFGSGPCGHPTEDACVWSTEEWGQWLCGQNEGQACRAVNVGGGPAEHAFPIEPGDVGRFVLTAPCGVAGRGPATAVNIPAMTDFNGTGLGRLPTALKADVECSDSIAVGDLTVGLDDSESIQGRGLEYAVDVIPLSNNGLGPIDLTVKISAPADVAVAVWTGQEPEGPGATNTDLTIPSGQQEIVRYRALCPDSASHPTDYPLGLEVSDTTTAQTLTSQSVTLTCSLAPLNVRLTNGDLRYEPAFAPPALPELSLPAYVWGTLDLSSSLNAGSVQWLWELDADPTTDLYYVRKADWDDWKKRVDEYQTLIRRPACASPAEDEERECPDPIERSPGLTSGLFSGAVETGGQNASETIVIHWLCPEPGADPGERPVESRGVTFQGKRNPSPHEMSRRFSQTIRKSCRTPATLNPVNHFRVHQGLVVQDDQSAGPVDMHAELQRHVSIELLHPATWNVTSTVGGNPRIQAAQASRGDGLDPDTLAAVAIHTADIPTRNQARTIAVYEVNEPVRSPVDIEMLLTFPSSADPSSARFERFHTFGLNPPQTTEARVPTWRPVRILGTAPNDEFWADLARRAPFQFDASTSTIEGAPTSSLTTASAMLTEWVNHAEHPADWVFIPATSGRAPNAWPLGLHPGPSSTTGIHYARVALVPEPTSSNRGASNWVNYADQLDAWSHPMARWLDANEPEFPHVTWLNLIRDGLDNGSQPPIVRPTFPNGAHDITDNRPATAGVMGLPSIATWKRMTSRTRAALDALTWRLPESDDAGSLVIVASEDAPPADGTAPNTATPVLDPAKPSWGMSPRGSGGARDWTVAIHKAPAPTTQSPNPTCGDRPAPTSGDRRIRVPLTAFEGFTDSSHEGYPRGIAWRFPAPAETDRPPATSPTDGIWLIYVQAKSGGDWACASIDVPRLSL